MKLNGYKERRQFSDGFIPHIKSIVGQFLIRNSNFEEDVKQATDFVVLNVSGKKLMCRIRRMNQVKYMGQFTIRTSKFGWNDSEFDKVKKGFGDWMFYGFGEDDTKQVIHWWLLDMGKFRAHVNGPEPHAYRSEEKENDDGSSFISFWIDSFDPGIIVQTSQPLQPPLMPTPEPSPQVTDTADLKWPNPDLLMARARTRIKDLRRLVEWHKLSGQDLKVIQDELNILATMVNKKALK